MSAPTDDHEITRGVRLLTCTSHDDARGRLIIIDGVPPLPFDVKRVYAILGCPPDRVRGEHAISAHTALVALHGAVSIDLDNGEDPCSLRLQRPDEALVIAAGVWLRLYDFDEAAVVLALASRPYAETRYFETPMPDLISKVERA